MSEPCRSFHFAASDATVDAGCFAREQYARGSIVLPYIGWLGHRNIGDDIVFDLLCHLIRDVLDDGDGNVALEFLRDAGPAREDVPIDWRAASGVVLGGGSTIDAFYIDRLIPALDLGLPVFCFASGFQKDDPLTEAETASIRRLAAVRFGSVRGRATQEILQAICGGTDLPAVIDGGLLAPVFYNANHLSTESARFLADSAGRKLVAINCLDLDYIIPELATTMRGLATDHAFVLLPFDDSTLNGLKRVRAAAGPGCLVHLETRFTDYRRPLAWFARAEFSLNMKLHASVLSSAVGTPPVGVGGGRKIDEYFGSIGASRLRAVDQKAAAILAGGAVARALRPTFQADMRTRVTATYLAHIERIVALLAADRIQERLTRLRAPLTVIGVQALDYGVIAVAGSGHASWAGRGVSRVN